MKLIPLLTLLIVMGCATKMETKPDAAQILKDRFCDCWMWSSPRAGRQIVTEWYNYRTKQGCEEYKSCGICEVCGEQGHHAADPRDRSKDIELCDRHYLERYYQISQAPKCP